MIIDLTGALYLLVFMSERGKHGGRVVPGKAD